jgi:phosphopantetheine adenylyltransferase
LVHEFAELKKQEGRPFYHTLLKNLLVSHDDKTVYITLTNNRDSNGFAEVKTELLSYINSQTGHSFSLEVKIEKIQQQHITVYTNRDKFKYLVDKNPFLLTFAKELDLEIE